MLIPAVVLGINSQVGYVTENEKRLWGSHLNAGPSGMMWFSYAHGLSIQWHPGLSLSTVLVSPSHLCGLPKSSNAAGVPRRARAHWWGCRAMLASRQGLGTEIGLAAEWGRLCRTGLPLPAPQQGKATMGFAIYSPDRAQDCPSYKNKMPACLSQERDLSGGEGALIWFISLFLLPIVCGSSSCSDKEERYERTLLAAGIPSFCPLTAWRHQSFTSTIKCVSKMWQSAPSRFCSLDNTNSCQKKSILSSLSRPLSLYICSLIFTGFTQSACSGKKKISCSLKESKFSNCCSPIDVSS